MGNYWRFVYADDIVLMSETLEGLMEKFRKWKEVFERTRFEVNLGKTQMVVSGTEGERVESIVDPCGVCGKRTMVK